MNKDSRGKGTGNKSDNGEGREERPFFATGEIVGSYRLLYTYWRHAGPKAEESILREQDFQHLQSLVAQGYNRLDTLLAQLRGHFRDRIDPEAARKAAKEYYGVDMPQDEAVDRVADQLAGWLIEAAGQWGLVKIRRAWSSEARGEEEEKPPSNQAERQQSVE